MTQLVESDTCDSHNLRTTNAVGDEKRVGPNGAEFGQPAADLGLGVATLPGNGTSRSDHGPGEYRNGSESPAASAAESLAAFAESAKLDVRGLAPATRQHDNVLNGNDGLTLPPPERNASDVLANLRANRFVVQDFRPLSESIEWDLGRLFYQERGSRAFRTTEHVPFEINNDGTLSAHAAEVLFASLVDAERSRELGPAIFALEFGPGTGLFARFLLDAFRDLCARQEKDFYDRLCFVLADYSEQMLADIDRAGVLGPHRNRCQLVRADARDIKSSFGIGDPSGTPTVGPFDAIFLNYMLDSLPVAVLELNDAFVKELRVRTCLARNFNPHNGLQLTPATIIQKASSKDPSDRRMLIDLYPYFTLDFDYFPVATAGIPYAEFAIAYGRRTGRHVLHSFGAIQCLEGCLKVLSSDGFILLNDYGQVSTEDAVEGSLHQKFSGSTHIGLNFPLLGAFFQDISGCRWVEPDRDRESMHARMLGRNLRQGGIDQFRRCFDKSTEDWLNEPVTRALQFQQCAHYEAALGAYQEALARQPRNWRLMGEVAKYLIFALRDFGSALRLAATAISLSADNSADLWDTAGDAFLGLEMRDHGLAAFQRALVIDETDVRGRLGLAHILSHRADFTEAMRMIAEGIALDKTGQYREMLLRKQADIVLEIDHQNREEMRVMMARHTRHPDGSQCVRPEKLDFDQVPH